MISFLSVCLYCSWIWHHSMRSNLSSFSLPHGGRSTALGIKIFNKSTICAAFSKHQYHILMIEKWKVLFTAKEFMVCVHYSVDERHSFAHGWLVGGLWMKTAAQLVLPPKGKDRSHLTNYWFDSLPPCFWFFIIYRIKNEYEIISAMRNFAVPAYYPCF